MTSSGSQVAIPNLRRHADPPVLWVVVLLGSLLLNGGLLLAFSKYIEQLEPVATQFAPIAVDFLPIASSSSSANLNPAATSSSQRETTSPTAAPAASARPAVPATTRTQSADVAFSPTAKPSPLKRSPATQTADPGINTAPNATSTLQPNPAAALRQESAAPPVDDQQVATSGVTLPDFTPPPDPKANPGNSTPATTATLPLNRNTTTPKFGIQVTVLPQAESQTNLTTDTPPTQQTKTLASGEAGCFVVPEALRHFNQPEEFSLTLNETGMVVDAVPTTPDAIANQSYQQLAICTLKTLSFNPQLLPTAIEPNASKLAVQVILQKQ